MNTIMVCMNIDNNWQNYDEGVIPSCDIDLDSGHCMQLVGYSADGTGSINSNYWKFKNSWG